LQHFHVIVALGSFGCAVLLFLLWSKKSENGFNRGKQPLGSRSHDEKRLSSAEKQTLVKASELAGAGQVHSAVQLLEQMGLYRQAINMFEQHGQIEDAAGILIKMQLPDRAGHMLARHGRWKLAADYFLVAGNPSSAAKCLRELGQLSDAAKLFLQEGRFEEAGNCYLQIKKWHDAAKCYLKASNVDRAQFAYERLFEKPPGTDTSPKFEEFEVKFFKEQLEQGVILLGFIHAISGVGTLVDVIMSHLQKGNRDSVTRIMSSDFSDLGPVLISRVNFQKPEAKLLAEIFSSLNQFSYSGMTYEQIGVFKLAGESFSKAEDWDRAIYCFERSGDLDLAKAIQSKASGLNSASASGDAFSNNAQDQTQATVLPPQLSHDADRSYQPAKEQFSAGSVGVFAVDMTGSGMKKRQQAKPGFFALPILDGIDRSIVSDIWDSGRMSSYHERDMIANPSEVQGNVYWVISGSVELSFAGVSPTPKSIIEIKSGEVFGELALFGLSAAEVQISAKSTCEVMVISASKLSPILESDSRLATRMYKHFTGRLAGLAFNTSISLDILTAS
jgi:tetratricopeptide (TPR) repeat protein